MKTEYQIKELYPVYDSRKSFYGKAQIWDSPDEIKLKSYDTFVASIKDNQLIIVDGIKNWSQTTKRHIREFAKQYGYINDVK